MKYEFVTYSPEFHDGIVDLRKRVFGGSIAYNAAYLDWKYLQNPFLTEPCIYLALHAGQVVGMRGMYGSQWQIGESATPQVFPAGADFAVDPDHRGRGLPAKIMALARADLAGAGHSHGISLAAGRTTRLLQLRAGWKRVATYETYRRGKFPKLPVTVGRQLLRIARISKRARKSARAWTRRLLNLSLQQKPFQRLDAWSRVAQFPICVTSAPRIEAMCQLVASQNAPSTICHARDATFYDWKFNDPRSAYRFAYFEQANMLEGFMVLQQRMAGGPITVVDWETSSHHVWEALIRALVSSGIKALQITSSTFSEEQAQTLRDLDFERVSYTNTRTHPAPGIFITALTETGDSTWSLNGLSLLDAAYWDIRVIASDAF